MKKIIAVMLILTFCVTTAFAFVPGEEIIFTDDSPEWGETTPDNELSTTYYSIAGQTWTSGKDLVSSVRIDNDDNTIVLKLKTDYMSTKQKTLNGTIKVRDKKKGRFLELTITDASVGYTQGTIDIESDGNIPTLTVDPETVYTVVASDKSYPYGTLLFQADVADVEVRVYDKEKYYLGFTREPNKEILKANAETDAVIEFLNFEGTPTFSGTANLNFYGFEEDDHIYELKNNKLVKTTAKWDKDTDSHVIKTRTLGSYVISDKTLRGASNAANPDIDDEDENGVNPDTGANDVAGIAMALAALSLVSAAAISLKKN